MDDPRRDPPASSGVGLRELDEPNPLLRLWRNAPADQPEPSLRDRLVREYSFAIPNEESLSAVADHSSGGVLEVGSGTGYWSRLLSERGVDVIASDIAPAPSTDNRWFAGCLPWSHIRAIDHRLAAQHPARSLLLVWPTQNEDWPSECLERFADAGGATVLYVGEPPGGRTGDDRFHALLGEYDRCWHCALGVLSTPCICGVVPRFIRRSLTQIPRWTGFRDDFVSYERVETAEALSPRPRLRRARRGRRNP